MKIKNSKKLIVFVLAMFLWVSFFIGVKTMAYASSTAFNPGTTIGLGQVDLSINHKITFESDVDLDGTNNALVFALVDDQGNYLTEAHSVVGTIPANSILNMEGINSVWFGDLPTAVGTKNANTYEIETLDILKGASGTKNVSLKILAIKGSVVNSAVSITQLLPEITNYNITLNENILVNFIVNMNGNEDVTAKVTFNEEEFVLPIEDGSFTFDKVYAQHIGDTMTIVLMQNGVQIGETLTESVKNYCEKVIALEQVAGFSDAKLTAFKQLAVDLLYYGAEAQKYINHDTENLPTSNVQSEPTTFNQNSLESDTAGTQPTRSQTTNENYYWKSANIVYGSQLFFRFKFVAPADSQNLSVTVDGNTIEQFTKVEDNSLAHGLCYYVFDYEVSLTKFNEVLTLQLKQGSEVYQTLTYTVNYYILQALEIYQSSNANYCELLKRLYNYGKSASEFLKVA